MNIEIYEKNEDLRDSLILSTDFILGLVSAGVENDDFYRVKEALLREENNLKAEVVNKEEETIMIVLEEEYQLRKHEWRTHRFGELILYRSETGRFNGAEYIEYSEEFQ
jgi:hypothetical protein